MRLKAPIKEAYSRHVTRPMAPFLGSWSRKSASHSGAEKEEILSFSDERSSKVVFGGHQIVIPPALLELKTAEEDLSLLRVR